MKRASISFAVALAIFAPTSAKAADGGVPPRVAVSVPRCDKMPFETQAFLELLRIELGADGVGAVVLESAESDGEPLARIAVDMLSCNRDVSQVVLTVFDRLTDKSVGRGIDLGKVEPSARARFVALAAAELLRASWLELASSRSRLVPDSVMRSTRARIDSFVGPRVVSPPVAEPAQPAPATWIGLAGTMRAFPAAQAAVIGPTMTLSVPVSSTELRAGAHFGVGEGYDVLGTVALGMASGSVAWLARAKSQALTVTIGPRVEAGAGWVRGDAIAAGVRGGDGSAPVILAGFAGGVRGELSPRWACALSFDGGMTVASVEATADGRRTAGIQGPFAAVSLGVELVP